MKIIENPVSFDELWNKREIEFEEIIKIVVDIDKRILAIDAELHADLEKLLLENGSEPKYLWGANLKPSGLGPDFIEYISFINIRPSQKNKTMFVEDNDIRNKIESIVNKLLLR
jgi:hypothetical protein